MQQANCGHGCLLSEKIDALDDLTDAIHQLRRALVGINQAEWCAWIDREIERNNGRRPVKDDDQCAPQSY